jgi:hypothetical protein
VVAGSARNCESATLRAPVDDAAAAQWYLVHGQLCQGVVNHPAELVSMRDHAAGPRARVLLHGFVYTNSDVFHV